MTIFRLQDIFSKSTVLPVIGQFTVKDFPHACRKNFIKSTVFIENTWFIPHFDRNANGLKVRDGNSIVLTFGLVFMRKAAGGVNMTPPPVLNRVKVYEFNSQSI